LKLLSDNDQTIRGLEKMASLAITNLSSRSDDDNDYALTQTIAEDLKFPKKMFKGNKAACLAVAKFVVIAR